MLPSRRLISREMRFYYDLHIHSCLSPCGDDDMTPCNIVGMAKLIGLDVIAITDHNTCRNAPAVLGAAGKAGITALAGMELTTSEDVHIVMLFPTLENALEFNRYVDSKRMRVGNRSEIYGKQLILDENDSVIGEDDDLLIAATGIGVYDAQKLALDYGGVAIPAHIDRDANGLVAMLGALDRDMGFAAVEFSPTASEEFRKKYTNEGYGFVRNSDAHRLENISERENFIELDKLTPEAIINRLRGK